MSATGQALSNYVTMMSGPRRPGEVDGPETLHLVIVDHGRRALLGTAYEEMLACIRCGACLNVCPVYRRIGGHAYDSVYSGPMGKVLTPLLSAGAKGRDLPGASTLCGACTEACPVEIPLADMLVRLRADLRDPPPLVAAKNVARNDAPLPLTRVTEAAEGRVRRAGIRGWARLWSSPAGYRASTAVVRVTTYAGRDGWARRFPGLPGLSGWTGARDLPLPARRTFRDRYARRREGHAW
jgi:L-lactate dehydrogenase complex protein LldF